MHTLNLHLVYYELTKLFLGLFEPAPRVLAHYDDPHKPTTISDKLVCPDVTS